MGHTHYNELANDGHTIFMATRSTGQVEEGPVGCSYTAIDGDVVSWRFKPLDDPWPLVMITSPADHRLITNPDSPDQIVCASLRIAAEVWGLSGGSRVCASVESGPDIPLAPDGRSAGLWSAVLNETLANGLHQLTVRAESQTGAAGSETISFMVHQNGTFERPPAIGDGSDRDSVGAWPEKHLLGTQLGPNRNGRKW
jgi:hypothetical protein